MDREKVARELAEVVNRNSGENDSNTPDFIIGEYLVKCLEAYNAAIVSRNDWYFVPGRANRNIIDPMEPNTHYELRDLKL